MKRSARSVSMQSLLMFTLCISMISISQTANAQEDNKDVKKQTKGALMEFIEDEYVPSSRDLHEKSPAYRFRSENVTTVQVNVDGNGFNIVNDAANEPSITFDPGNPDKMAIGWRQFNNINNNFRQAGYGFTTDGGESWTFPGVIEPGVFRSDPVLRCDGDGNFYYNSLTSSAGDYWTNVFRSADGGDSWEMGTFAQGGDKQWMSIDMTDGMGSGNIYEFWNGNYSICTPDNFTRSTDGNNSYESCSWIPGGPYWGTTMVSPDGILYMCGAEWGGFMLARSSNAQDPDADVNWELTVSVSLGGEIIGFGGYQCPNPEGLLGQTIIAMDSSGGPGDGNIYLLCSVDSFTNSDPCDVRFIRSTDGGYTWSPSVRINDDLGNSAYQWFGTMSVAPDGRIDVIWLDTRNSLGSVNSALFYSYSLDQGETWTPNVQISEIFDPHLGWPQQSKMGDYFDMYSDESGAHLAWAATFNGEQDVYYSLITPSYVGVNEKGRGSHVSLLQSYPNPFIDQTTIRYNLVNKDFVSLKVYSMTGKEVATLVEETQEPGLHQFVFSASGLESGVYYYTIQTANYSGTQRMILLK